MLALGTEGWKSCWYQKRCGSDW